MGACIRQCGVEGPWCFNLVIRTALDMLWDRWESRGVEAPLLGRANLKGWADNLILVSRSMQEAQVMLNESTEVLHSFGMEWKASWVEATCVGLPARPSEGELRLMTPAGDELPVPLLDGMTLLGGLVPADLLAPIEHRLAQASRKFWQHSPFFLFRRIPWQTRLKEFAKRVYQVATYGAATWKLTKSALRTIHRWGSTRLRQIVGVALRQDEEDFGAWRRRHSKMAREAMNAATATRIIDMCAIRFFRWATSAMVRMANDIHPQTNRRVWPTESARAEVIGSMRAGLLPQKCAAWNKAKCAPAAAIMMNDESKWRMTQAIGLDRPTQHAGVAAPTTRPGDQVGDAACDLRGERMEVPGLDADMGV